MTLAVVRNDEPLADRLATWARTRPDTLAYTYVDHLADPRGVPHGCTWSELHRQATGLAERLRRVAGPGERVAVLAPSGLEYVVAMAAAWYAGMIAVPLFAPSLPGHADRLAATYEDCAPACVVTDPASSAGVHEFVAARRRRATIVVADGSPGTGPPPGPVRRDDVAYLQYSSGSTRTPAGVEITHGNLTANVHQIQRALIGDRSPVTGVNWLPLFHDMGLLATVAIPMWAGTRAVFFDPAAFLMQPVRWLRLLSGQPAAYTAAPNFAYDYCLRRLGHDDLAGLDLRGVFRWLNGAEPVRAATLERFARRLTAAGTGLDENAVAPAYGLAEATVFVAADGLDRRPRTTAFDRARLGAGQAVPAEAGADHATLVSCGHPVGQRVAIVALGRAVAVPDGQVGEIWVHGPNVARRYWRRPEHSEQTFGATLAGPVPDGLPQGPWLRTGDLGVRHDGELYVTGRLKDLMIVAGRNHYPQDVEETTAGACGVLGRVAAFTVPVEEHEGVVVVAERSRSAGAADWRPDEITRTVRRAVWRRHDLALHDVVLVEPGSIPRTTSGKVSRTACRDQYLALGPAAEGRGGAGDA
ncbi:fatty acyl-AMP ligase [Actinoplanes sp. NEAU-A12]|uniref:Fatty acyl-AMP ligase n=1 Tax=Actinoplanes sandaracinus TaxID=3045177 RepID=A0ABT6WZK9_9ACTN|nr:fatty acyl-AMP ligase [Actinoplanes sandaracinus]MDI6105197.1 fatty acyl-AMP ligase [Actinoplanes sandaracinus]